MRICGVELSGGEAILCLLSYEGDTFTVPECRKRSFSVSKSSETDNIRDFSFAFNKLMEDYKIDRIVILERHQKGKFAGSATSFKLEAAIQLQERPVDLISVLDVKEQIKRNPPHVDFDTLGLKKFQKTAFETVYAFQNRLIYQK
ncbi:DUF3010 family protein [Parashewanella curva]|uniref:DUF3010 family protein n=1 Tax=Parashewanella curva TaxID=2338552 RepID=A0A3L8Q060_9GAMM|nr:DUF3010 family protein [Parashewanella curva]RLV60419.1 DUF3010 family protein [Parashewanella curva]